MARLSSDIRLLALALLNYADDSGYFYADPALIRGECMPFTESSVSIQASLTTLVNIGWIELRQHSELGPIGHIKNFAKHQIVNRPTPSKLEDYWMSLMPHGGFSEPSLPEQGTGNREVEQGTREAASRPISRKKPTHPNPASSREECQRFAIEIGSHWRDGDAFWDTMEESGWTKKDGKVPVLDWKKTMRKWVSSGWLPSAKATLNWSEPPPWEQIQHTSEEEFIPGPSDKDDIRASMAKAREENRRIESGECELELISEE